jgi:hypothetical protein
MIKRRGQLWILTLVCVVLASAAANAAWVKNGVPLCTADAYRYGPRIIQDGRHGAIVVWNDYRTGVDYDIYGNGIDSSGSIAGSPSGVPACTAADNQEIWGVILDGAGGVIVAWRDVRDGTSRAYAQRFDSMGNTVWATDGIDVCPGALYVAYARVISDGAGGAIFAWFENRVSGDDIFAQRIDADGNPVWGDSGVCACNDPGEQYNADLVTDGSGGAIVAWGDYRGEGDIYAQRIDGAGTVLWDSAGVAVCTAGNTQDLPRLVPAPGGGAYVLWQDYRYGYSDVCVQLIDQNGTPVWVSDGIFVCDDAGSYDYKYSPQLVEDGSGGVIAAWYDYRDGNNNMVYAQRFDPDGTRAWGRYGKLLIPSHSYDSGLSMVSDGFGGAIVTGSLYWDEYAPTDIYAQRVDHSGNALWGPNGAVACGADGYQYAPVAAPDGLGGAIIAWQDCRAAALAGSDIYCQRIGPAGLWGNPEPAIVSCADVPADQGGWVRIKTRASALDAAGETATPIFGYNVWRMIEGSGGPKALSASAAAVPALDRSKLIALLSDPATAKGVRVKGAQAVSLGLPEGDWESVGYWFATRDTVYSVPVPTKNDSTEAGVPLEIFIVTAHASTAGVFVSSEPDTGYSVDNLAPGVTGGFAGTESASPPGLALSWASNAASDLWKYDVHRGGDALFVPDESNVIGSTAELALLDPTWHHAFFYFYKLVAVDRHGNKSVPALLGPEDIKVGTTLQNFAAALKQSAIEISWTLSEVDERAAFRVLRSTAGSEFAELLSTAIVRDALAFSIVDRGVEPGTSYRYRVDVVEASGSRALFTTQAISTPAMPLTLNQNHPNPFNPSTTIGYYLPEASVVTLEVYDSSGRLVSRLADHEKQEKGTHSVGWRGLDAQGRSASSGVYFYRLTSGKETISKKMVLLR